MGKTSAEQQQQQQTRDAGHEFGRLSKTIRKETVKQTEKCYACDKSFPHDGLKALDCCQRKYCQECVRLGSAECKLCHFRACFRCEFDTVSQANEQVLTDLDCYATLDDFVVDDLLERIGNERGVVLSFTERVHGDTFFHSTKTPGTWYISFPASRKLRDQESDKIVATVQAQVVFRYRDNEGWSLTTETFHHDWYEEGKDQFFVGEDEVVAAPDTCDRCEHRQPDLRQFFAPDGQFLKIYVSYLTSWMDQVLSNKQQTE